MDSSTGQTSFSLEGKSLKLNEKSDIEPHLSVLKGCGENVKEVRLSGNSLGYIDISDIFTSRLLSEIPQALTYLLEALVVLPKLQTVNLSDNALGLNTQAPLVAFLSAHIPLRNLILSNNGLGPRAGKLIAEALSVLAAKKEEARRAGQDIPRLETIVCERNRLENGSMDAWAKALIAHSGIKIVKMAQNGIRPEGIKTLVRKGLKCATGLQVLDLEDNTLALAGATALADTVPSWHHLTDLGVNDCLLGKDGSILLAEALEGGPKSLEALRLTFNGINSSGLNVLKRVIVGEGSSLPNLRRIELNGNRFSGNEEDVKAIRKKLLERVRAEGSESVMDDLEDIDEESSEEDEKSEGEAEEEEEEEEEEEGETEGKDIVEEKAEKIIKDAKRAEDEPAATEEDETIDALAAKLGGTTI